MRQADMGRHTRRQALVGTALLALTTGVFGQNLLQRPARLHEPTDTLRVNLNSAGVQANGTSDACALSADGRFVAYASVATNLAAGNPIGIRDVFLFDAQTRTTQLVSQSLTGDPGNGPSGTTIDVSANGRFVAFDSWAHDLVLGDTNAQVDVFVRDMLTGTTEMVSVDSTGTQGNTASSSVALSNDGRFVVFASWADNLIATDMNDQQDIFLHDRMTGTTRRVTETLFGVGGEGTSHSPTISSDGRYIAYSSRANNLVAEPLSIYHYIFVHDTQTSETWHASINSFGEHAHDHSDTRPGITPDGRYVVFASEAYNLAFPDLNWVSDIFLHDHQTGETTRISEGWLGQEGNGGSILPSISDDGRYIAFVSSATNLVPNDANGLDDVFLYDRVLGSMRKITEGALGGATNGPSTNAMLSTEGRHLLFGSEATDLVFGDTNGVRDVFLQRP